LAKYRLKLEVSILSQLRCWEQRQQSLLVSFPELFQSSPSLGAGSNMALSTLPLARYVSILSQLRCWEQQLRQLGQYFIQRVSILSQLRCWEQPEAERQAAEAAEVSILSQLRCWSNDSTRDFEKGFFVSILSQLRCWEQPPLMCELVPGFLFQSSPSLGARSNKVPPCPLVRASGFNPLPA